MKGLVIILLLSWIAPLAAWSEQDELRWRELNEELRCLVCQNQSIAESNAPLAEDLRVQVRQMIEQGKSDQDIRLYMTQRYGDFVLYRPPWNPRTWLLWAGPLFMLLIGGYFVWKLRNDSEAPTQTSKAQRQQLAEKLKALDDD